MERVMTEGEKLHAEQRRKFWRNLMIVGAFGAPLGFGVGFGFGKSRGDFDAFWTMVPQWLVVALVALSVGGLLYGSWRFYRSIDEIELYRVKDARIDFTIINQMADIGTITITSSDETTRDAPLVLRDIVRARARREALRGLVNAARQLRGVREIDMTHEDFEPRA